VEFKTKRVGVNPLNPVYNLPTRVQKPGTPNKFLKDSLDIADINGA
jgi:hypothetical protein